MNLIEAASSSPTRQIRRKHWEKDKVFNFSGSEQIFCDDAIATDWEPIIEKKTKKVVMYQGLYKYATDHKYFLTDNLFSSKDDARKRNNK